MRGGARCLDDGRVGMRMIGYKYLCIRYDDFIKGLEPSYYLLCATYYSCFANRWKKRVVP